MMKAFIFLFPLIASVLRKNVYQQHLQEINEKHAGREIERKMLRRGKIGTDYTRLIIQGQVRRHDIGNTERRDK